MGTDDRALLEIQKQVENAHKMRKEFGDISQENMKKLVAVTLGFLKSQLSGVEFNGVPGADIRLIQKLTIAN
jgi:hypothetical protein